MASSNCIQNKTNDNKGIILDMFDMIMAAKGDLSIGNDSGMYLSDLILAHNDLLVMQHDITNCIDNLKELCQELKKG